MNIWSVTQAYERSYGRCEGEQGELFSLCSAACAELECLIKENADRTDIRLVNLAAAMAHCNAVMKQTDSDENVTAFRAGDVQMSIEAGAAIKNASADRQRKYITALPLLRDSGFAFMQVKI